MRFHTNYEIWCIGDVYKVFFDSIKLLINKYVSNKEI